MLLKYHRTLVAFSGVLMLVTDACRANTLYWADLTSPGYISKSDIDSFSAGDILANLGYQPGALAIDGRTETMFWSENGLDGRIWRADLDGSDTQMIGATGRYLRDIAVDPIRRHIYWTRTLVPDQQAAIERSDFDFSNRETVLTIDEGSIGSLAIDPFHEMVYWTTSQIASPPIRNIRRASLDGSGIEILTAGQRYSDIEVDPYGGKVYWTTVDTGDRRIQRANLDGTVIEDVLRDTDDFSSFQGYVHLPSDLAIDLVNRKLYWLNNQFRDDRIMRSNLNGSNIEQLYAGHGRSGLIDLEFPRQIPEPASHTLVIASIVLAVQRRTLTLDCQATR